MLGFVINCVYICDMEIKAIGYETDGDLLHIAVTGYRVNVIYCVKQGFVTWYASKRKMTKHIDEIPYMLDRGEIYLSTMTLFLEYLVNKKGPTEAGPN